MKLVPLTPIELQSSLLGETLAFRDALIALIKLQPDMSAVAEAMRHEREETLTLLLNKGVPDATIEAYRDTFDMIRPYRNGEDPNPP